MGAGLANRPGAPELGGRLTTILRQFARKLAESANASGQKPRARKGRRCKENGLFLAFRTHSRLRAAFTSHVRGRGFESPHLHQRKTAGFIENLACSLSRQIPPISGIYNPCKGSGLGLPRSLVILPGFEWFSFRAVPRVTTFLRQSQTTSQVARLHRVRKTRAGRGLATRFARVNSGMR